MHAQLLSIIPTLCNPMDCSPPGSSVHGMFQARKLEWVAISFSRDLPNPGIEPASVESPALQADSLPLSHLGSPFSGHYLNPSLAPVTFQRILYFTCCLIYDPYMSAPWVQGVLSAGRGRARDWGLRSRRQGSLLWDCNAPFVQ